VELVAGNSSALQKRIERIEALKTAPQNFIIGHSFFGPTREDAIDADAFDALESGVVQVRVMNHLAKLCDGLVNDGKASGERLKRATIAVMRKFRV